MGIGIVHPYRAARTRTRLRRRHGHDPRRFLARQPGSAFSPRHRVTVAPRRAAVLGVLYALAEGFVLGAVSAAFDAQTEGIVGAAVLSTLCVFLVSLVLYVTRIVRPTQKLAFAVIAGMGGLMLLYFVMFVMSIFNWSWLYSDSFRTIGLVITIISVALRRAQPRAGLRRHRNGRGAACSERTQVVHGVQPDGHPDLAVHHAVEADRVAHPQSMTACQSASMSAFGENGPAHQIDRDRPFPVPRYGARSGTLRPGTTAAEER